MSQRRRTINLLILAILLVGLPVLLLAIKFRHFLLPQAAAPVAEVTVSPLTINKDKGETFNLNVSLTTDEPVSAAYLVFSFEKEVLTAESVSTDLVQFTDDLSPSVSQNPAGKLAISVVASKESSQLPRGTMPVADITLKGVDSGTSGFTVETTTQIVGPGTDDNFTLFEVVQTQEPVITIQSGEEEPTLTPTPPTTTPQLSFNLRFNGITHQGPPLPVRLRLVNPTNGETKDFSVTLEADSRGIYRTNGWAILSGLTANQPYNLLIKGPKHLQRRMETRTVLEGGQGSQNQFDWTDKPLEPGDLPNPNQDGDQDGVVNSIDASLVLERFGQSDAPATSVADLNYDGVVNLNDFSLLIATLSTKSEDED